MLVVIYFPGWRDYSQNTLSIPSKNPLLIWLFEYWIIILFNIMNPFTICWDFFFMITDWSKATNFMHTWKHIWTPLLKLVIFYINLSKVVFVFTHNEFVGQKKKKKTFGSLVNLYFWNIFSKLLSVFCQICFYWIAQHILIQ